MIHCPAVFQGKAGARAQTLLPGGDILLENPVHHGGKGGPQKIVDILIMVVKGVPADAAGTDNVLYGDLIQGILVEKQQKGVHDCFFRPFLCHRRASFRKSYNCNILAYSACFRKAGNMLIFF